MFTAVVLSACGPHRGATGAVDRTFTVNGPVHLELTNGSGDTNVSAGAAGEVRIHAELNVKGWPWQDAQRRLQEISANPPISQQGDMIRIGGFGPAWSSATVNYTIEVPANTEIHGLSGSGNLNVRGIQGPANLLTGSGDILASQIAGDVQVLTGSGEIKLSNIEGQVQATAGSGDITLIAVHGEIRVHTGSGTIQIAQPGETAVAGTGSGNVTVTGASADLRLRTGSGNITVDGNPGGSNYWDLRAASGNVVLHVPSGASFRLYARTTSGDINAAIPIVMEGTTAKHELRARIGDGKARVEISTTSGKIALH
jgi:hypothetical protein